MTYATVHAVQPKSQQLWAGSLQKILLLDVQHNHFARSMAYANPLDVRTGHDRQLRRHTACPEDWDFAILDDWRLAEFWAVHVRDTELSRRIQPLKFVQLISLT